MIPQSNGCASARQYLRPVSRCPKTGMPSPSAVGVDEQVEVVGDQRRDQGAPAIGGQVTAGLRLELVDGFRDVAARDDGVVPPRGGAGVGAGGRRRTTMTTASGGLYD
jgi:hypothetical protein